LITGTRNLVGRIVAPTALVLGAGFSKWAAGLPIASQLFDFRIRVRHARERSRLESIKHRWREYVSQHSADTAEQFIGAMISANARDARAVKWYVTRRLSDPFIDSVMGGTQALMIDDSRAANIRGVIRARQFLQHVCEVPINGIVTPNYDLLVEHALGTSAFHYGERGEILYGRGKDRGFPWRGAWPILTGHIPLAKIHGSVSWDDTTRYTDGRAGVNGDALIVAPHGGKSLPIALRPVWTTARSILRSASRVLVFGFAFNPYDEAVLRLLAAGHNCVRSVLLVDVNPNVLGAQKVWPNADVTFCPPPQAGKAALRDWLGQYWVTA
jgi:hypothetical protein